MAQRIDDPAAYIADRVEVDDNGCWNWSLSRNSRGYGLCYRRDWRGLAHRFAYTRLVEEIASDAQIDHLCMNKACVNPAHLEAVSASENARRDRRSRSGRNYTVYQQSDGLWCAGFSHRAGGKRIRKSFRSKSRDTAVAKIEDWLSQSR